MTRLHPDTHALLALVFILVALVLTTKPAAAQYADTQGYGLRQYNYYGNYWPYVYPQPQLTRPPGIYWDPDSHYGQYGYSRPWVPSYGYNGWNDGGWRRYGPDFDVWDRYDDNEPRRSRRDGFRQRHGGGRLRTG